MHMLRNLFFRDRTKQRYEVGEFAHANANLLIIVMDPKDDTIFVAHNNRFVGGKIKAPDGQHAHIVDDVLRSSSAFKKRIDGVLMAIMDTLRIRRLSYGVNNVLQFIDGALFNIAQRHVKKQSVGMPEGTVESPLSVADVVGPPQKD